MFKFSTNTLLNFAEFNGKKRFETVTGTDSKGETVNTLRIRKHFQFRDKNIVAVYKRPYEAPAREQVSIDMANITKPGIYRIALYVRLSGSQNSYFSNDFVFKGKPFFIEFYVKPSKDDPEAIADTDTPDVIANRVVRIAKKYLNMVYEFPLIDIKAEDTKVILTASDEYQRFKVVRLEWYNEEAKSYDCCANFGRFEGEDSINEMSPIYQGGIVLEQAGHEGFGTYWQITKDLRLPTAANTRWNRIVIDETPILTGKYTEYVIKYCVNRGIMGSDAVGEVTKSLTNHVFYVEDSVIEAWEEELNKVLKTSNAVVETVDKDKDDKALKDSNKNEVYDQEEIDEALGVKINSEGLVSASNEEDGGEDTPNP